MDKSFEIEQQLRYNAKAIQTYLTDLKNWEIEMKRKEAALKGEFDQKLPPVRSRKEKPVKLKKKTEKRITASDYKAWEKFDVDKACQEVDMADVGPVSLDSKKSQLEKDKKLREEAKLEKEKGNSYVKQEKWDEAISCYDRAIHLVKDDAIYYANRGLCYLKKDSLHQADADCTEALRLDPTYVKALQRRATAREKLGSLRAASHDLNEVMKLEPHNAAAKKQLDAIISRMGTKGIKSKSSPLTTPIIESKPIVPKSIPAPKIVELPDEPKKELSPVEKWKNGVNENITVIRPVKKPPHLRSKRALKHVTIQEIPLGRTLLEKQLIKVNSNDTNNNDNNDINDIDNKIVNSDISVSSNMNMVPPVNSVQFMSDWKYLKGNDGGRSDYLSIINPSKLPSIFENALESDVLSEVISTLHNNKDKFRQISAYLTGLSRVKRFSALAMFLTTEDKRLLNNMLEHCKAVDNISDSELTDLINKYEL